MKICFAVSGLLLLLLTSVAHAERRALLIGNASYDVRPLYNPGNDVDEMQKKLEQLRFKVTPLKNLRRAEMRKRIRQFASSIRDGDEAIFYFSGHGAQVSGENYLLPIKHDIQQEFEISDGGVSLNFVLGQLVNAPSRYNVVILDACRDNPFHSEFKSVSRGLARLPKSVGSTLVAFAASPGGVSNDGQGRNGTYTKHLLKHMGTPGITLSQMFNRVRKDVYQASRKQQFPKEENGLFEDVYLGSLKPLSERVQQAFDRLLMNEEETSDSVWISKNKWDTKWENNYRAWVRKYWKEEIFMDEKKPSYYKLVHDYESASYFMRLVFAFEHRLPFSLKSTVLSKRISNANKSWKAFPIHTRLRRFMEYISENTDGRSLVNDTYPIALNDIKPGDIYLAPDGVSFQITNVSEVGVAEIVYSGKWKADRFLDELTVFPPYVPGVSGLKDDGYRRFIQPQNQHKKLISQPGYSIEQYKVAKAVNYEPRKFNEIASSALAKRKEKYDEKTIRLMVGLCQAANDRGVAVHDSLWVLQTIRKQGRQCMSSKEYSEHSTRTIDRHLKLHFTAVKDHVKSKPNVKTTQQQLWAETLFAKGDPSSENKRALNNFCMVQMALGEDYHMSLRTFRQNLFSGYATDNPNAPLEYRWGVVPKVFKTDCSVY